MRAIVFDRYGGPEVLESREVAEPACAADEAVVEVKACGINHLDLWVRRGLPGLEPEMPHILGSDVVGEVAAVGAGVRHAKVGDRGWCTHAVVRRVRGVRGRRRQPVPAPRRARRAGATAATPSSWRCRARTCLPLPGRAAVGAGRGGAAGVPDRVAHAGRARAGARRRGRAGDRRRQRRGQRRDPDRAPARRARHRHRRQRREARAGAGARRPRRGRPRGRGHRRARRARSPAGRASRSCSSTSAARCSSRRSPRWRATAGSSPAAPPSAPT